MLDFDDTNARRADRDDVNLVRLKLMCDREGQVRQQNPFIIADGTLQLLIQMLGRESFTFIDSGFAVENGNSHNENSTRNR